jgi:23S rRNA (adenine1618-N6)-methyltransferase
VSSVRLCLGHANPFYSVVPSDRKSQQPILPRGVPHPRNRHRERYDFSALIRSVPALAPFVGPHPLGGRTIDFSDPAAVRALNRAILLHDYGLVHWELPSGYLCPPIPSRANYVHHVADLLAAGGSIPHGPGVAILDIGVGANCIYPILGVHEYGWRFVGSDIDPVALRSAAEIVAANPSLAGRAEVRLQASTTPVFHGIIRPGETFAATLCNPPFHASHAAATAGTRRKRTAQCDKEAPRTTTVNFGGQENELWCPGGEGAFVARLIAESADFASNVHWFTTLVSQRGNLPALRRALESVRATEVRVIPMGQGQKQSRLLAWTFRSSA